MKIVVQVDKHGFVKVRDLCNLMIKVGAATRPTVIQELLDIFMKRAIPFDSETFTPCNRRNWVDGLMGENNLQVITAAMPEFEFVTEPTP